MKLVIHEVTLPLRHAFTITHGTTHVKRNLLLELQSDGLSGWGEAAPSLAYRQITVDSIRSSLEKCRAQIESAKWETPGELWEAMFPILGDDRFALCALDEAAHDLWGKRLQAPVWKLWGLTLDDLPLSNYTIGIDTIEVMIRKMEEFADWPIFKIKLGTDRDVEIVQELRKHTDAIFRIDANTAWTVEQAMNFAPKLAELGVEFIEQPLARDDWEGMRILKAHCPLPIIADEACQIEEDVEKCAEVFDGVNVKLTKAGGLTPGRRMIQKAKSLGLKAMAGCMVETSVGISAQAQLLPMLDYVDLDGALLLAGDVAQGVRVERGCVQFPSDPGNGITNVIVPG